MPGRIEETILRQPICDECGPLGPIADRPLSEAEAELDAHDEAEHNTPEEDG